jgi:hypothetical protein
VTIGVTMDNVKGQVLLRAVFFIIATLLIIGIGGATWFGVVGIAMFGAFLVWQVTRLRKAVGEHGEPSVIARSALPPWRTMLRRLLLLGGLILLAVVVEALAVAVFH